MVTYGTALVLFLLAQVQFGLSKSIRLVRSSAGFNLPLHQRNLRALRKHFNRTSDAIRAHQRGKWVPANLAHLPIVERKQLECLRADESKSVYECSKFIKQLNQKRLQFGAALHSYECPFLNTTAKDFNEEYVHGMEEEFGAFGAGSVAELMRNKVLLLFGEVSSPNERAHSSCYCVLFFVSQLLNSCSNLLSVD
jgi:hypothetical protein